jgi:hypothetical protein
VRWRFSNVIRSNAATQAGMHMFAVAVHSITLSSAQQSLGSGMG